MSKKIIVALDLDNIEKAIKLVKELKKRLMLLKLVMNFFITLE